MKDYIDVSVHRVPYSGSIGIWFSVRQGDKMAMAKPMELDFETVEEGALDVPPTLTLPSDIADAFMDALAQELEDRGIRTKNVNHLEGEIEATKLHLDDMRKLVFKKE